jgi:spore germination cell wall hydrolase CwlJ-like protein
MPTPTGTQTLEQQAVLAALQANPATPELTDGSVPVGATVDTTPIRRSAQGELAALPKHAGLSVEELPAAGQIDAFDITAPHDGRIEPLVFSARETPPAEIVTYSSFSKRVPSADPAMLARPPNDRSESAGVASRSAKDDVLDGTKSPLLAYAPANPDHEAPFDALMGGLRGAEDDEVAVYMPRPRPDEATVEAWLDGRSPAQFIAGQHAWMQNSLPASAHEKAQQKCLAEAIYFEARGEPEAGQAAVAQVVLNRVRNPAYPNTICDVVYQNKHLKNRCQFSFACDGIKDRVRAFSRAWRTAQRIAKDVTDGKIWLKDVADSTHYHANYVHPAWGSTMIKKDRVGAHIFYRTRYGGWS